MPHTSILAKKLYANFIAEQVGDPESTSWEAFYKSLLTITYLRLPVEQRPHFLSLIRAKNFEAVEALVNQYFKNDDAEVVAKSIRKHIEQSIDEALVS